MKACLLIISVVLLATISLNGCSKEVAKSIFFSGYSDCKSSTQNSGTYSLSDIDSEYIQYSTLEPNVLAIIHHNLLLNCELKSFIVDSKIVSDTIKISYTAIGNDANCLCKRDIGYSIKELPYALYVVQIRLDNFLYATFNLDFSSKAQGEIVLK